jgi:hypothetical protein
MTLIFTLSQNSLEIYKDKYEFESLIYSVDNGIKVLQLHDKFETIWTKLFDKHITKATKIVINIKPKASFTDTRIISIWCRSHCMFNPITSLIINGESVEKNVSKIIYSQDPKIGSKAG